MEPFLQFSRRFWRLYLLGFLAWGAIALFQLGKILEAEDLIATSARWRGGYYLGWGGLALILGLFGLSFFSPWKGLERLGNGFSHGLRRLGPLNLVLFTLCGGVIPFVVAGSGKYARFVDDWGPRMLIFWTLALLAALFLRAATRMGGGEAFLAAILWLASANKIAGYFADVSDTPFSRGWSEGSRFYYASLFFARSLYGQDLALPFLHPTRYLMQSVPFLIPGLPIWVHRLWQVLLWLSMTGLAAGLIVRRLRLTGRLLRWMAAAWAFLFIFQGPVYYHLLVCAIIVLWGFDSRRFGRSLLVILLASVWAGVSRINWIPVPVCLAILIYLLETPFPSRGWRGWVDYFWQPAVWVAVAGISALGTQRAYIYLSGVKDLSVFSSSLNSDLLWYRLWPNSTYWPGMLLGTLIAAALPLLALGGNLWRRGWHPIRVLGVAGILGVFFGGGMLVSMKIGGGSNLHNMDAFLVLLLVCVGYVLADRVVPQPGAAALRPVWRPAWLFFLLVLIPAAWFLQDHYTYKFRATPAEMQELEQLQTLVQQANARGERVLFIWQRQLQVFNQMPGVQLEAPFETVELMEMVMSENWNYLGALHDNLEKHRYGLVIAGRQSVVSKINTEAFADENELWVVRLSMPMLRQYEETTYFPETGIQILEPIPARK